MRTLATWCLHPLHWACIRGIRARIHRGLEWSFSVLQRHVPRVKALQLSYTYIRTISVHFSLSFAYLVHHWTQGTQVLQCQEVGVPTSWLALLNMR